MEVEIRVTRKYSSGMRTALCQPYMLRWWPLDVSTSVCGGRAVQWGPIKKFEQVSSDGHRMSLAGGGPEGPMSRGQGKRASHVWSCGPGPEGRSLYSKVKCIMGNSHVPTPLNRMTDRHLWKYYFPATSLAGGNETQMSKSVFNLTIRFWKYLH